MSVVAIDTHAFIKRMTGSGMPEAQAEVLAETLAEPPLPISRDAVVESVERLGRSIDRRFKAVDQRITDLETKVDTGFLEVRACLHRLEHHMGGMGQRQDSLEQSMGGIEQRQDRLEHNMGVLMENQLHTNRSVDAIMAHLGITKPM